MPAPGRNPFWDFSLAVWGREAVKPACLALQARHGIDVNILLFCGCCRCASSESGSMSRR